MRQRKNWYIILCIVKFMRESSPYQKVLLAECAAKIMLGWKP